MLARKTQLLVRLCLLGVVMVIPTTALPSIPWVRHLPGNEGVIIFVHGIMGDERSTWTSGVQYWPSMLGLDSTFNGQDIYVYHYPSPRFGSTFSIDEITENMRLVLATDGVLSHKELSFVSHSMGGIVTRAFILKYREIVPKIRLLYFFATPTTGSPYAVLAGIVSKNPQFKQLYPMQSDNYLGPLQSNWLAANLGLKSFCAYETVPLYGQIIVERQSATNLCTQRLDPIDADHLTIVKPVDRNSTPYRALKAAFEETARANAEQPSVNRGNKKVITSPSAVSVTCQPSNDRSACELACVVRNSSSAATRDVAVGFNSFFPIDTQVSAPADVRIRLEKSDILPVPDPSGKLVREIRAFTLYIPLMSPRSEIPFSLWTDNEDNRRGCEQLIGINQRRRRVVDNFFRKLVEEKVMASRELPDLEVLFSATAKRENLFQPDSVLSDQGRRRVDLLMPAEEHALRQQEDAYRFKPQFVDVFKTREECLAPVFTVEQTGGASVSFASYPADVPTFSFVKFAVPLTSQVLTERPTPPPQYNCLPVHP